MNRKGRQEQEQIQLQAVIPKFAANWGQNVRVDKVIINVSDCVYEVVSRAAKEQRWRTCSDASNPEWDVWWTDWAVNSDTLMRMEHHQKINHFPGMYVLSRKNLLARNLMRLRRKLPDLYSFFPLTWTLPGDLPDLRTQFESKPKGKARTFIIKPQSLSQGKGIFLTRKLEDIIAMQNCVVQRYCLLTQVPLSPNRYISRPYLIDNLKFDLRLYVLVGGVEPLRLYLYKEGLGRFATEEYLPPSRDNIDDTCMHLTNYAINKGSDKFVFNTDGKDDGVGHKRSLEAVMRQLQDKGVDIVQLQQRIDQLIVKTMLSGLSHLRFQYRSSQPDNFRGDMCFEVLGFDVILTDEAVPQLLEVNYTPSFATDTPLDENIKRALIRDTLVLMGVGKTLKESIVNERREVREQRMRTGKKLKLTPEEREQKRIAVQLARDQYESTRMGAFRKIFPTQNAAQMECYQQIIRLEEELSSANVVPNKLQDKNDKADKHDQFNTKGDKSNKEDKNQIKFNGSVNERRKTEKVSKLPNIAEGGFSAGTSKRKSQFVRSSAKGNAMKLENDLPPADTEALLRDFSVKIMKQTHAKEMSAKKVLLRERLVPKTIQFQTDILNGHCDPNYFLKLYKE